MQKNHINQHNFYTDEELCYLFINAAQKVKNPTNLSLDQLFKTGKKAQNTTLFFANAIAVLSDLQNGGIRYVELTNDNQKIDRDELGIFAIQNSKKFNYMHKNSGVNVMLMNYIIMSNTYLKPNFQDLISYIENDLKIALVLPPGEGKKISENGLVDTFEKPKYIKQPRSFEPDFN